MSSSLLLIAAVFSVGGASLSLVLSHWEQVSKTVGCLCGLIASIFGVGAGLLALFGNGALLWFPTLFPFATFSVLWSPLSGLLVVVISLLALAAWLYAFSYFNEYRGRGIGKLCFFMNLFIVSMIMVVLVDNAFWFLVFFELMSLTSYFLVIFDQSEQSLKGGFLYFVMAHIGFMLIMISFLIMAYMAQGSFDFADFRLLSLSPIQASLVFILAFLGFGIKAGMVPFHSWLPQAHPAAPSNVSALMSGGMVKIGVFGIVKVCFDLLAVSGCQLWWGIVVIAFGVLSAVLGIAYATYENDIKRVLAYCTVENIGIIFIGIGTAIFGWALNEPLMAGLGLTAALYHLLNHAMFKGSLFLGAGSILYRVHSRSFDDMGGLARAMPLTAAMFLIGAVAVCAIPPLNGFVSEWITYQSLLSVALGTDALVKSCAVVAAAALAITGALAVVCFVRTYGITFSGVPRSEHANEAREVPPCMVIANAILILMSIALGVGAAWFAPLMQGIADSMIPLAGCVVAVGTSLINIETGGMVSLLALVVLLVVVVLLLRSIQGIANRRAGVGIREEPWDCGYLPDSFMPSTSHTFAATTNMFFGSIYEMRRSVVAHKSLVIRAYEAFVRVLQRIEPLGDRYLVDGTIALVDRLGRLAQRMESGDFRVYILYVVISLIFFLVLAVVLG